MNFYDATVESIVLNEQPEQKKLSFDNPTLDKLKESFPDLKVYGPEANRFRPMQRIVTNSGGWVEITEALEIKGCGVIFREFDIYDRRQTPELLFIPNACLIENIDGFVEIRKDYKNGLVNAIAERLPNMDADTQGAFIKTLTEFGILDEDDRGD